MTNARTPKATYTKLRSGAWGVRIEGPAPAEGTTITVTTKAGAVKTETIERVLWSGNGIALCAIVARSAPSYGGGYRRYYAAGGDVYTRANGTRGVRGCAACARLGDLCPSCRHDEDDC